VSWWAWILVAVATALVIVFVYDLVQRRTAVLRNFPVIGHLRFLLEGIGPELRQYIVTDNDSEKPFSRDQRRWVYTSAERANTYFGFGTDNDLEGSPNYLVVKHVAFPAPEPAPGDPSGPPEYRIPYAKVIGGPRARTHAFRPTSVVNLSSMSYGSLGAKAIEALNRAASLASCWQGTGEGGITPYHANGGDLLWQIGTGYFGCRDAEGRFSLDHFRETLAEHPTVRAIDLKLSQGAKPGLGGLLPGAKVTKEIGALRGVPVGVDCLSPPTHSAFSDADSLLDFVELLAETSGLPVGIKSAVGDLSLFEDLAHHMTSGERGIDFLTVDGGEGGTGAAPLAFADHVAQPFKIGFSQVYRVFASAGITGRLAFIGSGKLGFPDAALLAFALGCDGVNVGREAMLSIGCIQAQRCHTGHCPTGVTTSNAWLQHGLDPTIKSVRCASYLVRLRQEVLQLSRATGHEHPSGVTLDDLDILDDRFGARSARHVFGYEPGWGAGPTPITGEIPSR
jgi:glutamate synthase domain-containing protein 2